MALRPDVAVLGASAAGLAAAVSAAREGASVVLLDGRESIGEPEPPATVAFDFLWRSWLEPPPGAIRRRLDGVRLQSPRGHSLEIVAPLRVFDRVVYDRHLASEAERAGARVHMGVSGMRVRPDRTIVAEGLEVEPRLVIFADGAGTLARQFVESVRHPDGLTWGAALRFTRPYAGRERLLTLTLGSHAPGGRSQLNPLGGDLWSHWTFYRGEPSEGPARARAALEVDAHLRGWDPSLAAGAEFVGVSPDPVLTLPGRLVADGVMVVGAAGGQGGLEVGVSAGELAGRVAAAAAASGDASARSLGAYERAWKREHLAGYRALRRAVLRLSKLDDDGIDKLLAPWGGWRIPVRDFVGLAHPSPLRRAEAIGKFVARNPHAVPRAALAGLRMLLP